jgi:hypothetical protein
LADEEYLRIVETVGQSGIPPKNGFQYFLAGLEPYLSTLREDYLETFIKDGGSSFKMVIGVYGGGKTHLSYQWRREAISKSHR